MILSSEETLVVYFSLNALISVRNNPPEFGELVFIPLILLFAKPLYMLGLYKIKV